MQHVISRSLCIVLFLACGLCHTALAQINLYPASYGIVSETKAIFDPALANISGKYTVLLGNQYFPGTYSQLENHFFMATINVSRDSGNNKNIIGIKLITEKEGEYIHRPKAYLTYAFHTAVFKDYFLSAGANVGVAGYAYKPTNVSAEGSALAPDADLGIGLYNKSLIAGISLNQAFNATLTPKQQEFRYKRFLTLYLEKKIIVNDNLSFLLNYQFQDLKGYHQYHTLGVRLLLSKLLEVGSNVLPVERLTFILGLHDLSIEKHRFRLLFGYNVPLKLAAQSNIQSFEVMLTYFRL